MQRNISSATVHEHFTQDVAFVVFVIRAEVFFRPAKSLALAECVSAINIVSFNDDGWAAVNMCTSYEALTTGGHS